MDLNKHMRIYDALLVCTCVLETFTFNANIMYIIKLTILNSNATCSRVYNRQKIHENQRDQVVFLWFLSIAFTCGW